MGLFNKKPSFNKTKLQTRLKLTRIEITQKKSYIENELVTKKRALRELLNRPEKKVQTDNIKIRLKVTEITGLESKITAIEHLSHFCETLEGRVDLIANSKEVPIHDKTAIHSLVYAASRLNLKHLQEVRDFLKAKYPNIEREADGCDSVLDSITYALTPKETHVLDAFTVDKLKSLADEFGINIDYMFETNEEDENEKEDEEEDPLQNRFKGVNSQAWNEHRVNFEHVAKPPPIVPNQQHSPEYLHPSNTYSNQYQQPHHQPQQNPYEQHNTERYQPLNMSKPLTRFDNYGNLQQPSYNQQQPTYYPPAPNKNDIEPNTYGQNNYPNNPHYGSNVNHQSPQQSSPQQYQQPQPQYQYQQPQQPQQQYQQPQQQYQQPQQQYQQYQPQQDQQQQPQQIRGSLEPRPTTDGIDADLAESFSLLNSGNIDTSNVNNGNGGDDMTNIFASSLNHVPHASQERHHNGDNGAAPPPSNQDIWDDIMN